MRAAPFVIFALPRSRTAWLAHWLQRVSGHPVGHDLAIEADTIDGWLELVFRHFRGTCETGAVEAWPILRRAIPNCRIVTVHRPVCEVAASLVRAGAAPPVDDLKRRAAALDVLADQGGLAVEFHDLADPRVCATVQEYCLGAPFDWPAWRELESRYIELDLPIRMARLAERAAPIASLKAELAQRLESPAPFVTVGEEAWDDVADDCEALGAVHHVEATKGIEGPFKLDRTTLGQMASNGLWRVFIARVDGVIAGYCCWSHEINHEADAAPTMEHGPFYVSPERARHRLGMRLLQASRTTFAANGYKVLRLHHTMYGRGERAGKLYQSLGAVEYQREYIWPIG